MTVQFSGGEPTISPIFLDAVRYARKVGYFSVQAATNGIRFAQDPQFAHQAREAGMRIAYLQFDGVSEEANAHRRVGNLFDVKLRAIENLYAAGIDVCLVVTIVNTVNDDQVGPIVKFALQNCDKISFVSFQPVSFTGRDEDDRRRGTACQALHAVASRRRHAASDRRHRAAARLVPALGVERDVARHRSAAGPRGRLGIAELRLPSRLRCRHGLHGQQEDEEVGAALGVPEPRTGPAGRAGHLRQRPRQGADGCADGAEPAPKLQSGQGAGGLPPDRPAAEVRQAKRRAAGRPPRRVRRRQSQERRMAADVRRRHVVSGSVDLRFPAHRDVHHPLRHADGRNLVLRVQHGRRLAADRREHVSEREGRGLVQRARQASRVRQPAQAGAAAVQFDTGDAAHPEGRPAGAVGAEASAPAGTPEPVSSIRS